MRSQAGELRAVGIVDINDTCRGRTCPCPFKQAALGSEVVLEGLVKIEMVAREVREDRRRKPAAPQTVLRQRV